VAADYAFDEEMYVVTLLIKKQASMMRKHFALRSLPAAALLAYGALHCQSALADALDGCTVALVDCATGLNTDPTGGAMTATTVGNNTGVTTINGNGGSITVDINGLTTTNINTNTGANTTLGNSTGIVGITGATSINASGASATNISTGASTGVTNIGTGSSSGAVTIGRTSGTVTVNSGTTVNGTMGVNGATSITGAATIVGSTAIIGSTTIIGATSINAGGASATNIGAGSSTGVTNIGTGSSSGAVTIGRAGGTLTSDSATSVNNTFGVDSNGGTGQAAGNGLLAVTNSNSVSLGVASGATTMGGAFSATSSSARMSVGDTTTSSGYNTYGAPRVAGTSYTLLNGNAASRAAVTGASVNNIIVGNTLVDGNLYVNGAMTYSSTTSANTTVANMAAGTSGAMNIVNNGRSGYVVNGAGRIVGGTTSSSSTASLTVTNANNDVHGFVVNNSVATMSGGGHSSSLTMSDSGATFSNTANGAAIQVHGVDDGTNAFDAVNYRQLQDVAAGVAGVAAMTHIPSVDPGKRFALGMGYGNFESQNAFAFGGSARFADNVVVRASVASDTKQTTFGVGAGYSW
jgi:hypothetical protein